MSAYFLSLVRDFAGFCCSLHLSVNLLVDCDGTDQTSWMYKLISASAIAYLKCCQST